MKYYTYIHKRAKTGEVFYVGKGTGRRAWWKFHEDNKKWCRIAKKGYTVEIVNRWPDNTNARIDEADLIKYYLNQGCDLANKMVNENFYPANYYNRTRKREINYDKWLDLYDLYVDLNRYHANLKMMPNGCLEQVAGSRHNQGYMMINSIRKSDLKGIMVTGHRVAARLKYKRAIDSSECVIRTCGNPKCHNQDHIKLGTRADRVIVNSGVKGHVKEARRQNRKYKWPVVDMIYMRDHTSKEIAAHYNVDPKIAHNMHYRTQSMTWLDHFNAHDGKLKVEYRYLYAMDFVD